MANLGPTHSGKRILGWTAFRWITTIVLLGFALMQLRSFDVSAILSDDGAFVLAFSVPVVILVVLINGARWYFVARILKVRLPFWKALRWTLVGNFFNQLLPGSVGGDVIRGLLAARWNGNTRGTITSILLERTAGFLLLLMIIAVGQPFLAARLADPSTSWLTAAATLAGIGLILSPFIVAPILRRFWPGRLADLLTRFIFDIRQFLRAPWLALAVFAGAFAIQSLTLLLTAAIANQFGASISVFDVFLVMPGVVLLASLPISVGGWGVREAGLAAGFWLLGQPPSVAVVTSIVLGIANVLSGLPGIVAWALPPPRPLANPASDGEAP